MMTQKKSGKPRKPDDDPLGEKLIEIEEPLKVALEFTAALQSSCSGELDTWLVSP